MANLYAYLSFNGNCKEAMEFYKGCLGGELEIMTIGSSPETARMPVEMHGKIMHSMLTSGKMVLMGADAIGEKEYKPGNTVSLSLVCESKEEIEDFFLKLSKGGRVMHPLNKEFFGIYGDLTDRYGFNWMFQFGDNQQK